MIPVAEWLPDGPELGEGGTEAKNVIAAARSYRPFPSLNEYSAAAGSGTVMGAASFRATDLSVKTFCGNATKLYSLSNASWTDVSRTAGGAYAAASAAMWRFAQFGDDCIAVNGTDVPQAVAMTAGTNFAALGGSPPTGARYATVVRDVVVLGRDSTNSNRVSWSDVNSDTTWSSGSADHQDMPDGGQIMGLAGGQYLLVFQERAIRLGTYTSYPLTFTFDKISEDKGCMAEYSIASHEGLTFFVGSDGLYMMQGTQLVPIGAEKVNRYFLNNVDLNHLNRVTGAIDPVNQLYVLGFPDTTNQNGTPNQALIYNFQIGRWSRAVFDHEFLLTGMIQSAWNTDNLDTLLTDTDASTALTDSAQFTGSGRQILGAFSAAHKLGFFDGSPMAATVDTGEAQLTPGSRSTVWGAFPLVDGGTASMQIGTRNKPGDGVTWSASIPANSIGKCPFRANARFHRGRISLASGGAWSHIVGINPEFQPAGYR